jgi:L-threonylcarbamoyladenylate synthase
VIVSEQKAADALRAGAVVAIPTDTVYGLAADPRLFGATDRLFELKGRPEGTALPVLVADRSAAALLAALDDRAESLIARFWPGALTIVLRRLGSVVFDLGGNAATIGLRCPAHDVGRRLLKRTGPLAVTSANLHGQPPCHSAEQLTAVFGDSLRILDGGVCDGAPSTVVSLAGADIACLREGAIPMADVEAALA